MRESEVMAILVVVVVHGRVEGGNRKGNDAIILQLKSKIIIKPKNIKMKSISFKHIVKTPKSISFSYVQMPKGYQQGFGTRKKLSC